jgi:hypothetical protein
VALTQNLLIQSPFVLIILAVTAVLLAIYLLQMPDLAYSSFIL